MWFAPQAASAPAGRAGAAAGAGAAAAPAAGAAGTAPVRSLRRPARRLLPRHSSGRCRAGAANAPRRERREPVRRRWAPAAGAPAAAAGAAGAGRAVVVRAVPAAHLRPVRKSSPGSGNEADFAEAAKRARCRWARRTDEWTFGNIDEGFKKADLVLDETFVTPVDRPSAARNAQRDGVLAERQAVSCTARRRARCRRSAPSRAGSASRRRRSS